MDAGAAGGSAGSESNDASGASNGGTGGSDASTYDGGSEPSGNGGAGGVVTGIDGSTLTGAPPGSTIAPATISSFPNATSGNQLAGGVVITFGGGSSSTSAVVTVPASGLAKPSSTASIPVVLPVTSGSFGSATGATASTDGSVTFVVTSPGTYAIAWRDPTVAVQDFETIGAPDPWASDGSDKQAGANGAHPKSLPDGGSASFSYSCDDKPHSKLSFWYRGVAPAAGQALNFYIDGVLYKTYGNTNIGQGGYSWVQVVVVVPGSTPTTSKKHSYRWEATTDRAGQPPYWLDSIRCSDVPPVANTSNRFEFEEGFVPEEISGSFEIDNSDNESPSGALSAHPPLLPDGGKATMDFSCGDKPHTELTFWYRGVAPTAAQPMNFYIDGVLYKTYGNTNIGQGGYSWVPVTVVLPGASATTDKKHSYRWEVTTDRAGQPPYWIDSIQCVDKTPVANTSNRFEFEEGFVPEEISGSFEIDNSDNETAGGSLSAHPPLLPGNAKATMDFSCGGALHKQLTFWYRGVAPTAGQPLNFYVDGVLYKTYGNTNIGQGGYSWVQITGPLGQSAATHSYRWEAVTDTAAQPPYWVDGIQCQ